MNSQKGKDFAAHKELLKRNETSKSKEGTANASKEPIRKSGTHSGLRFNFNLKKDVALKAINFEEKGNVSIVRKQTVASQSKEGCTDSEDRIKSLRSNIPVNNTQTVKGVEHSTILTKKEETELCSIVPKSLKVLQPSAQTLKVVKCVTLKPAAISPNSSRIPIFNVPDDVKVSKGQSTERKEISKSSTGRNTEDSISIVRKQILASQNKEGSNDSGDRIKSLKVKVPVNAQTVEAVERYTILTKKETESSSNVAKSLKGLRPSPHTSKVVKSLASLTLTPKAGPSNTTKLPTFNVRDDVKASKSQSTERKEVSKSAAERSTEVTQKKFGSHSGLKFKLSVNKSSFSSGEQYGFTSTVSRSNSYKSEMNPQQTKDQTSLARGNLRK